MNANNDNTDKLVLLDGSVLQGYTPQQVVERGSVSNLKTRTAREEASKKFFTDHAFFFLAHAKEILADSRMFLAPVCVRNGLAYTGRCGFESPTLGVYVEWWLNCPRAMQEIKGRKMLVWYIAGSPLSGANRCSLVDENGNTKTKCITPFIDLWSSFVKINNRYKDAKAEFQAFTVEEVYNLLLDDNHIDREKHNLIIDNFMLRSQAVIITQKLQQAEQRVDELSKQLSHATIQLHEDALKGIYEEYVIQQNKRRKRREELRHAKMMWRKQLKSDAISNVEYQKIIMPINKELRDLYYWSDYDLRKRLYKVNLSLSDLIKYFEERESDEARVQ